MKGLHDVLQQADRDRTAVGHFNISDLAALKGVTAASRALDQPVLIGASEGERAFMGVPEVAALVEAVRGATGRPVFLDADHTHSLARAEEAARAGFDMIVFDASTSPFEENVRQTREAVEAVKSIDPRIIVEGELGYIGSGSEIHEEAPEISLTTPEEARHFVAATHVDVLAPAVGNMHGLLKSMVRGEVRKRLDIDRIAAIKAATGTLLTLHGGSGTDDDDLKKAIKAGISIIHINTEIRLAWRRALESALAKNPDEVTPYKLLAPAVAAIEQTVRKRLSLFGSA